MGVPDKVVLHPLVLLSVVDHYNRTARDTKKRVVGLLLGDTYKGQVRRSAALLALLAPTLQHACMLRGACCVPIAVPALTPAFTHASSKLNTKNVCLHLIPGGRHKQLCDPL